VTGSGMPTRDEPTYSQVVGTPAEAERRSGIRMSRPAVDAFETLSKSQQAAVAEAIRRIGPDAGTLLKIPPGGSGGGYLAMVPSDPDGPVVIYRRLTADEGDGYLVTAIVGRSEYKSYQRAERQGILDTPLGRLLLWHSE
jgi:hypothetical protein